MYLNQYRNIRENLIMLNYFLEAEEAKEDSISDEESDNDSNDTSIADTVSSHGYRPRRSSLSLSAKQNHYGSFYLRMGAVGGYYKITQK